MKKKQLFFLLVVFLFNASFMPDKKKLSILCLGDSYTIGESVDKTETFPAQVAAFMKNSGVEIIEPVIIAKTGWTTDELAAAIKEKNLTNKFDLVTLLIGVNNQYRRRDPQNYAAEFRGLLLTALDYAGGNRNHVFVLSIPDWGVTPFGEKDQRGQKKIAEEIDLFNSINREVSLHEQVNYLDITPISREAKINPELITGDGLHPSGKMYKEWAERLFLKIKKHLPK